MPDKYFHYAAPVIQKSPPDVLDKISAWSLLSFQYINDIRDFSLCSDIK